MDYGGYDDPYAQSFGNNAGGAGGFPVPIGAPDFSAPPQTYNQTQSSQGGSSGGGMRGGPSGGRGGRAMGSAPFGRGGGMPRGGGMMARGGGMGGPPRGGMAPQGFGGGGGMNEFGMPPAQGAPGYGYEQSPLDAEVEMVLHEMHTEIAALDSAMEYMEQFKNARRLLSTEVERLENNIDPEWLEVDVSKPIKLVRKILIPTFRNPRFNYVGKILGPRGATLQNIAKTFKCHVYVLGRGSTRDRQREEEMLNSGDPQHAHFAGPLHVKVETNAPPSVAYTRVAGVLEVLAQLLQPVKDTHIPGITSSDEMGMKLNGGGGGDDLDDNSIKLEPNDSVEGPNGEGPNDMSHLPESDNGQRGGGGRGGRGGGFRGGRGGMGGGPMRDMRMPMRGGRGMGGGPMGGRGMSMGRGMGMGRGGPRFQPY